MRRPGELLFVTDRPVRRRHGDPKIIPGFSYMMGGRHERVTGRHGKDVVRTRSEGRFERHVPRHILVDVSSKGRGRGRQSHGKKYVLCPRKEYKFALTGCRSRTGDGVKKKSTFSLFLLTSTIYQTRMEHNVLQLSPPLRFYFF